MHMDALYKHRYSKHYCSASTSSAANVVVECQHSADIANSCAAANMHTSSTELLTFAARYQTAKVIRLSDSTNGVNSAAS